MDPMDTRSVERIVDANLNRAAEALRVVEDVCRFHWNLQGFARDLKGLRHRLLGALSTDAARRRGRLLARDIEGDVGAACPSPPHAGRDLAEVALRNLQRAKEALRTLEESVRPDAPERAQDLMGIRYELYAVEKGIGSLGSGDELRGRLSAARLQLLASPGVSDRPLGDLVRDAVAAGVDMVQLRVKGADDRGTLRLARTLRELTARTGALFVVNDRPDLAVLSGADGVHVGQADLPIAEARTIVGDRRLVGASTHSVDEARVAERSGADYIGVGPVFASSTKDAGPLLGPEGLREILEAVSLPAFAIGGIDPESVGTVVEAGAKRLAVSSGVLRARDVGAAVRAYRRGLPDLGR
jgi:thiamine-phosphate pyrophosphorylase